MTCRPRSSWAPTFAPAGAVTWMARPRRSALAVTWPTFSDTATPCGTGAGAGDGVGAGTGAGGAYAAAGGSGGPQSGSEPVAVRTEEAEIVHRSAPNALKRATSIPEELWNATPVPSGAHDGSVYCAS